MSKRKNNGFAFKLFMICLYYVPALAYMIIYSNLPAIPFVKVSGLAYVFVGILFVAGALLSIGYPIGGIFGVAGCIFGIIANRLFTGFWDMRLILISSICLIAYLFFMINVEDVSKKKKR